MPFSPEPLSKPSLACQLCDCLYIHNKIFNIEDFIMNIMPYLLLVNDKLLFLLTILNLIMILVFHYERTFVGGIHVGRWGRAVARRAYTAKRLSFFR